MEKAMPGRLAKTKSVDPAAIPASLDYAMPPEWLPHDATWLAWPSPSGRAEWPGKFEPIPWVFAEIVRLLAQGERVHLFVEPSKRGTFAKSVHETLDHAGVNLAHVTLHTQSTDRPWLRDSGPIFLTRKIENGGGRQSEIEKPSPLALVDFKFTAWARYPNFAYDDVLPQAVARALHVPRFEALGTNDRGQTRRFVLEGGSIDINGRGSLLTTEQCLLSRVQHRNPGFSRERIEQTLRDYLGIEQVLWLGRGITGDDTHGHVDDLARFVNPTTIVTTVETDRHDINYEPLHDNLRRLKKMRDLRGRPFDIVELPTPGPVTFTDRRLPASYANFYIANAGVLVPVFNDPADTQALRILEACFPDRPLLPVYCRDLVLGLGTLHCLTQQQPAVGA
jgi:agmatine deiminase